MCEIWHILGMKFTRLLEIVGDDPLFETGLLLAGQVQPDEIRRQLARWTAAGRLYQVRRGLYTLAPPYRKVVPEPFLVANRLVRGSYVSLQSALAHYALIPEYVPVTTSVTTQRPGRWDTPLGSYVYQHIKMGLFRGYRWLELMGGQQAFVASPEKALLDLIYLWPGGDDPAYLRELRLQNMEQLHLEELRRLAELAGSPKLRRAAVVVAELARIEAEEYEVLP
jgi:predicted transcriptional regulator of viral defense system